MAFTPEALLTWLESLTHTPLLLALVLALATLVTEDGALVAGSLLVGAGMASPLVVLTALIMGIVGGDIALYGAGRSARAFKPLRRRLPLRKTKKLKKWLKGRETLVLFFSRFTPGTRLVTYLSFGFLKLSLLQFAIVMTIASAIWVTTIVFFVSEIQQALSGIGSTGATLVALVVAGLTIVFAPRLLSRLKPARALARMSGTRHK